MRLIVAMWAAALWLAGYSPAEPSRFFLDRGSYAKDSSFESLLLRELLRQEVLATARYDLGWSTADAVLGDTPGKTDQLWDLVILAKGGAGQVDLRRRAPDGAWEEIAAIKTDVNGWNNPAAFVESVADELAQELSGHLTAPDKSAATTAPAVLDLDELLDQPTMLAQFFAVRSLESAIRRDGGNPDLMANLTRAYAQLGWLTEYRWNPVHQVYKARAFACAKRLKRDGPRTPEALEHRALACAVAGWHADALTSIADAARLRATAGSTTPEWVRVVGSFCRFDIAALMELKSPWAVVLATSVVVETDNRQVELAERARHVAPDCIRLADVMVDVSGVSNLRRATSLGPRMLARQLQHSLSAGLFPAKTASIARRKPSGIDAVALENLTNHVINDADDEASPDGYLMLVRLKSVGHSLREASDDVDPSWTALAEMLTDTAFEQMVERLRCLDEMLDWDVDGALAAAQKIAGHHPYGKMIDTYGLDGDKPARWARLLADIAPVDVNVNMARLVARMQKAEAPVRERGDKLTRKITRALDYNCTGLRDRLRKTKPRQAEIDALARISPYEPVRARIDLQMNWAERRASAEEIGDKFRQHANLLAGLCKLYGQDQQIIEAERWGKAALALSNEPDYHHVLADAYFASNRPVDAIHTLESALKSAPDIGLQHAALRAKIIRWHASQGSYNNALPYAAPLAASWSGWGLLDAAMVYEGVGDFEQAEAYMRACSQRYDISCTEWARWCVRTGRGNRVDALRYGLLKMLPRAQDSQSPDDWLLVAVLMEHTGDHRGAAERFLKIAKENKDPFTAMMAAICAERGGDRKLMFTSLNHAVKECENFVYEGFPRKDTHAVAKAMLEFYRDKTAPDPVALRALVNNAPQPEAANVAFCAGVLLDAAKLPDAAELLKVSALSVHQNKYSSHLARDHLRARGLEPERVAPHRFYARWMAQGEELAGPPVSGQ